MAICHFSESEGRGECCGFSVPSSVFHHYFAVVSHCLSGPCPLPFIVWELRIASHSGHPMGQISCSCLNAKNQRISHRVLQFISQSLCSPLTLWAPLPSSFSTDFHLMLARIIVWYLQPRILNTTVFVCRKDNGSLFKITLTLKCWTAFGVLLTDPYILWRKKKRLKECYQSNCVFSKFTCWDPNPLYSKCDFR